jgi:hypothetical protein
MDSVKQAVRTWANPFYKVLVSLFRPPYDPLTHPLPLLLAPDETVVPETSLANQCILVLRRLSYAVSASVDT